MIRRWGSVRTGAKLFNENGLFIDAEYKTYRDQIRSYWKKHFGRPVHPLWHIACAKVTGKKDVRYIPGPEWSQEILPFFNDLSLRAAFRDKNLSDVFLDYTKAPRTIIKRMHGRYYSSDNTPISIAAVEQRLTASSKDMIIKGSQTDDGYDISQLVIKGTKPHLNDRPCTLGDLETRYGRNFIVQERITQHPLMAQVHPYSVNTIRLATFRWNSEIRLLMAVARFGSHGNLNDNASTGGLCCGIDEQGRLNDSAVDMAGVAYSNHPTSGYSFADRMRIPGYDGICELALALHREIFHFDIVGWDFAISVHEEPIFLEVNFRGAIHLYQFAGRRPMFGELTQDVLEVIRDARSDRPANW